MVYKYEWAQMQTLDSPVQSDGNLSPGGAARMRMIALTPRRSLEKAASRLAATGYSPTNRTQFEAQALEKELLPGFRGFFSNKERMPEGLGSPAESLRSRPPRSLVSTRAGEGDRFARSAGLESERDEPAPPEPFSPKKRGCAVAPCLSDLRLDDANLRCEAPSPGPQWSNETVKTIFPGPCKVRPYTRGARGSCLCCWKAKNSAPGLGPEEYSQDTPRIFTATHMLDFFALNKAGRVTPRMATPRLVRQPTPSSTTSVPMTEEQFLLLDYTRSVQIGKEAYSRRTDPLCYGGGGRERLY